MIRVESEGPPLVLIHGAGANAGVWEPLRAPLSSFDLYAPDLPGRGDSSGPACERAEDAARWLEGELEALDARGVIVLGHSYGGAVAIELALSSSRVAGLVLVASGARLRVHRAILEGAERAVQGGAPLPIDFCFTPHAPREAITLVAPLRDGIPTPANSSSYRPTVTPLHALITTYARAASATPPEATLADWRACDAFDRRGALAALDVPVLVMTGAADALTPPKYQRYLVEHLPRAQLELVEGAGHMLPWERPAELARAVRAWASGVG